MTKHEISHKNGVWRRFGVFYGNLGDFWGLRKKFFCHGILKKKIEMLDSIFFLCYK